MSRTWTKGSSRRWRQIRAYVLARDADQGWGCRAHEEGWCERSGRPGAHECLHRGEHAHHTKGRRKTGDDPERIVAACEPCNLHIGDPTVQPDPEPTPRTRW